MARFLASWYKLFGLYGCLAEGPDRVEDERHGVQGGYGALFAVWVQILLSITRVAVQV